MDISERKMDKKAIKLIGDILSDRKDTSARFALDNMWKDESLLKLLCVHPSRLRVRGFRRPQLLFDVPAIISLASGKDDSVDKLIAEILEHSDRLKVRSSYAISPDIEPLLKYIEKIAQKSEKPAISEKEGFVEIHIPKEIIQRNKIDDFDVATLLMEQIPDIAGRLQNYLFKMGFQFRHDLLTAAGVGFGTYSSSVARLHSESAILPMISVWICRKHPESPQYGMMFSSKLIPNMKCSLCGNDRNKKDSILIGTFFCFEPRLQEMLSRDGGLLPVSIMWLLESKRIEWVPDIEISESDKQRLDILAKHKTDKAYCLIESKVVELRDRSEDIVSQLQAYVRKQVVPATADWIRSGIPLKWTYLVTNYHGKPAFEDAKVELENIATNQLDEATDISIPSGFKFYALDLLSIRQRVIQDLAR